MTDLQKMNYLSAIERGKIEPLTKDISFYKVAQRQLMNIFHQLYRPQHMREEHAINEALGNLINACNNWLIKRGWDPEIILKNILEKNENRKD